MTYQQWNSSLKRHKGLKPGESMQRTPIKPKPKRKERTEDMPSLRARHRQEAAQYGLTMPSGHEIELEKLSDIPWHVRRRVLERDSYRCQHPECTSGYRITLHHRKRKGQGGSNEDLHNFATLCWDCHINRVHDNPAKAYREGWMVPAYGVNTARHTGD